MGESTVRHVSKLLAGVAIAFAVLPGAASAEDKTITAIFCGDKMQPVHAEYIKAWEAKNAGFKVAPEVVGWDQCQDKVTTLAAAGTPVGLAYVGSRTLKQFAANDLIVPIEYTEDEKKTYFPYIVETVTTDGKQWGIPVAFSTKSLYWNKDLFTQAGLDPEVAPKNLQEFADAARAVQALNIDGTYGTYFGGACGGCNVFTWWPIIWAGGGDVMNADGTEALLNSADAKAIYSTFNALWDEGVINPESQQEAGPTWTQPFPAGKVGIMPMPASLQESEGMPLDNLGVTAIAGVNGGESTFVGGDSIGISKDSENIEQAWNFITWMLGDENQVEVVAQAGNVVARTDLADNQYSSADPRLVLFNEVAGVGETPFALHFNAAFNDPQSPWIQLFRAAVFDDADDARIDELNAGITSVLQGN